MRRGIGVLWLVLTTIVVAVVGVIAYQAGWSQGFAQHVPEAAAGATTPIAYYPYYYYGPHFFGFGWIFGLLFFLFILFVIFRVASFGRWAGRGWGYGGRGGWKGYGGGGIPPAIDERMRAWHRQAHGEPPSEPGTTPPPPAPPDQRSV